MVLFSVDTGSTCCAGLAAATGGNGTGIMGTGSGCSLLAVRIAFSDDREPRRWVTSNEKIALGIDWAWENGADVLSNSWGGGTPSNAINEAFRRARTEGRGGQGCVIVIAAGNDNNVVSYPATLRDVLTVGASNEFDEPKTPQSKDGEAWWGSNFGPEVDIAAPGVHNLTTDNSGTAGYDPTHYYTSFNGTSSATPIVAGIAGLILSANPGLEESQVRQILIETADKVGSVPYFGGRNDRMGSGRVNAERAVRRAKELL